MNKYIFYGSAIILPILTMVVGSLGFLIYIPAAIFFGLILCILVKEVGKGMRSVHLLGYIITVAAASVISSPIAMAVGPNSDMKSLGIIMSVLLLAGLTILASLISLAVKNIKKSS